MDEQEAIARIKRGDVTGLEELVLLYQARAVHTAYLIVQDSPTAEDIVQGAFLQAYEKIDQFDDQRSFGPWFLRSVVNASIKVVNQQRQYVTIDEDEDDDSLQIIEQLADPRPGPEDIAAQAEMRRTVIQAMAKLSPEKRAAVVMRYYLELSETEMTHELRRPLSTVKWLLHSAKQRLRRLLIPTEASQEKVAVDCQESKYKEE
jgi:RNA polymerase sigma-70 factor (ECF subfamily)